MILGNRSGNCSYHDIQQSPAAITGEKDTQEHHCTEEVNKLKELLEQRDNEISILVKILKKEKKRASDATTQLADISNVQKNAAKSDAGLSAVQLPQAENNEPTSTGPRGRAVQYMKRGTDDD